MIRVSIDFNNRNYRNLRGQVAVLTEQEKRAIENRLDEFVFNPNAFSFLMEEKEVTRYINGYLVVAKYVTPPKCQLGQLSQWTAYYYC